MKLTTSKPIVVFTKEEWKVVNDFAKILVRDLDIEESEDCWDILTDIYYGTKENTIITMEVGNLE